MPLPLLFFREEFGYVVETSIVVVSFHDPPALQYACSFVC